MTFGQSIQTVFTRYAEFSGRAGRPEFWWWILFTTLVSAVLSPVPTWSFELSEGAVLTGPTLSGLWSLVVLLPTISLSRYTWSLTTVSSLRAAGARRTAHDPGTGSRRPPGEHREPRVRIERTTFRLQGGCSTN